MAKINKGSRGWANSPDDGKYTPKGDSDSWGAAGDRGSDEKGYERVAGLTWDDKNTAAFLKPSQTQTDHGDGRDSVEDISGDVFNHSGPAGTMLTGSGPVRQVGGGSGPPRFKPKSSAQARDDQSNGGL